MGNTYTVRQKDDENEGDLFYSSSKNDKLTDQNDMYLSKSKALNWVKGAKLGRTLLLPLIPPETRDHWLHELFLQHYHGQGIRVPKRLVSLDEKYLRRCLELIHMNASKGVPCDLSVNLSSMDFGLMSDYVTVPRRNSLDENKFAIDYPMDGGSKDLVINSEDDEIVGSIMGSDSMMRILVSPLFQKLGISVNDARLKGKSLLENKRCILSDYQDSACQLTSNPSQKPGKQPLALKDQDFTSDSTGMLRCTWKEGIPHFALSLDDQKELYVANAWKVDLIHDGKSLDYVYSFHLKPSDQKMHDIYDDGSELIGKMRVSTSFSLCSNNSKIMKTEFVLVIPDENHAREMHVPPQNSRHCRKMSKVMEVFKSGHSSKQQTPSIIGGTSNQDKKCKLYLSKSDFLPNLEMAAIIVKDHLQVHDCRKEEVGGWGLKFLKNGQVKQNVASSKACTSSGCCSQNKGDWSTSMDIIVPAGLHGGLRTQDGGPTSLVERWRLGGHCDCGGWDIGCPLKVLKAKPRKEERQLSTEAPRHCKSFDLFTEGSKQETPLVKMVNVHDNLYFISFKSSSLSALHCFSIAVAIFHSQSPTLRPKHVQD